MELGATLLRIKANLTVEAEHDWRRANDACGTHSSSARVTNAASADACRRRRRRPAAGGALGKREHGRHRGIDRGKARAHQRDADGSRGDVVWR